MTRIYIPSQGPQDWQWLLAKPGLHWKHGASAKALADAWEGADPWPPEVETALTSAGFGDLDLLVAIPEHLTPLPGGARASQTDLLVLARRAGGEQVVLAVEGKVAEPFGDHSVAEWRQQSDSKGRQDRLAFLLERLGLPDDDAAAGLRYQLLHRTAAALLEAERFGAPEAVMLVHSFSPTADWHNDYVRFAESLGADPGSQPIVSARVPGGVQLHLGWVTGDVAPLLQAPTPGRRFDRAVAVARELHAGQLRKGTKVPYVAHLLGVASLVLEDGGTENEAIAALLHDAVEDQGGASTLRRIEQLFGREVADIVAACSDTDAVPKPPWRERKEAYVAHLATARPSAVRVSLADKLHNARAILFDLHAGADVWRRFNADRDDVLWYYRALADAFRARDGGPMADELRRTVDAIEEHGSDSSRRSPGVLVSHEPASEDGANAVPAALDFSEPDNAIAEQFGRVIRALAQGRTDRAAAELVGLAGVTKSTHPIEPMPTLPREAWPKATHGQTRIPQFRRSHGSMSVIGSPASTAVAGQFRLSCSASSRTRFRPSSPITRTGSATSLRGCIGTSRRALTTCTLSPWAAITRPRPISRPRARAASTRSAISPWRRSAGPCVLTGPAGRGSSTSTDPCGSDSADQIRASTTRGREHSKPQGPRHQNRLQCCRDQRRRSKSVT